MDTQFDIDNIIELRAIQNELDFERALILERKLRLLAKEDSKYSIPRKKLRDLIAKYEAENWSSDSAISEDQIHESDLAELIAEKERVFIEKRKDLIKSKLKRFELNQQEFGLILGHQNKSYISELINGVRSFSLKDLIIINRILKIDLVDLIPTFLSQSERLKLQNSVTKLGKPKLKLSKDDFALV